MRSKHYYNYQREVKSNIAERIDLVTSPPKKQQHYIDMVKRDIDEMNCQEITITYKPSLMLTTDITLREITNGLLVHLVEGKASIKLIHEYSDAGRFHYHGIITGATRKLLSQIRKQFELHIGRIEIKQITYMESYLRYMTKQTMESDFDPLLNIFIN